MEQQSAKKLYEANVGSPPSSITPRAGGPCAGFGLLTGEGSQSKRTLTLMNPLPYAGGWAVAIVYEHLIGAIRHH